MIFNILSIIFGIIAVAVPVFSLFIKRSDSRKSSVISLVACMLVLFCQLAEYNQRVSNQDWSALLDTSRAIVFVSAILMIAVLALNVILYITKRGDRHCVNVPKISKKIDRC